MLNATLLCESKEEKADVVQKLKFLRGVQYIACDLSIRVEYDPDDTITSFEENRTLLRLFDIIESVKTHGFVLSTEEA